MQVREKDAVLDAKILVNDIQRLIVFCKKVIDVLIVLEADGAIIDKLLELVAFRWNQGGNLDAAQRGPIIVTLADRENGRIVPWTVYHAVKGAHGFDRRSRVEECLHLAEGVCKIPQCDRLPDDFLFAKRDLKIFDSFDKRGIGAEK